MNKNRIRYLNTYAGKSLLEKHSLDDEGTWEVLGEDSNCDLGGSHYQPRLGVYQGKLQDVIDMAVDMSAFWQWGAGGNINRIDIQKIDSNSVKRRKELLFKEHELMKQLEEVRDTLKSIR